MKKNTGKRLETFIDSLNISKNKFAESIGKKAQNLNIYFNGSTEVGYKMMNLIKSIYPQLNIDWLKTGNGSMLVNSMVSGFSENEISGGGVQDKEKEYINYKISDTYISRRFKRYCRKAGIDFKFHNLRNTFLKNLVNHKIHSFELKAVMNHSSIKTSEKYFKMYSEEFKKYYN